jgi:hypothetical protein
VLGACYLRHRHQEFLRFLRQVAKAYPRRQPHIVCDNDGTHASSAPSKRHRRLERPLPTLRLDQTADQLLPHATGGQRTSFARH